ncbi:MAG TPA: S9 family peptidase [Longimicrobiaceae bacterium]|jgi:dipeptidyl aminopeptidase/acylaminoacyl peptidase|nr:S9 family peptidase [Longimicrobiaceae bacterium]
MRTLARTLLFAALATSAPAAAQDRRPLTPLDLYHLRTAGDVALSPDGRSVVYVVTQPDSAENRYRRDLWMARTDGSGAPRRLTWTGGASLSAPAFSPDGTRLAFVAARAGGRPQVWILPLAEGGDAWPLTSLKTGASGPVWSPRGDRIAFTSSLSPAELDTARADTGKARVDAAAIRRIDRDRPAALAAIRAKLANDARSNDPRLVTRLEYMGETSVEDEESWRQVYVVDVQPEAKPLALTAARWESGAPAWSADGASIVFSASQPRGAYHPDYERESDLFVVPATGGALRRIAEAGSAESAPRYSPDGRWLVYERERVDTPFVGAVNTELVVMRPDGTDRRSVTASLDRSVTSYALTRDGWLYFTVPSEGSVLLYRTRLDRIAPEAVVTGPRGVLSFDVEGGTVAWSQMSPQRPSDVYAASLTGAGERRLTALNDSLLARVYVGDYEPLRYASFDGRRVDGWFIRPIGWRAGSRPPLALEMHGGPHTMWGPGEASMWLEYQSLAGAGYTVFFSNPRGSSGYGEKGLQSIHREWGSPPAQDILIGADSVIARGLADRDRQAMTGGSYAGYMTAWIVAKEAPSRFKAAAAQRGVYDLGTWWGSSNTWRLFEDEFGARPWEDPAIVRAQSPITYVANVRTPLLMLHGEADYRTTIAGAEAFYRALKVLDREVEFVRYPREGHELTRSGEPAHRVDHMLRIIEWFDRHIRPDAR